MNSCARGLVRQLAVGGSWMGRAEFEPPENCSEARLDDELADLVLAGTVLYNQRAREYKLAGTPLARKALQQLLASRDKRRMLGAQSPDKQRYLVGIATRSTAADGSEELQMAELEMPYPAGKPAELLLAAWAFGADLAAMPVEQGT